MKHIVKRVEPISFTQWKRLNPNNTYDDLVNPEKRDLKTALICEQKGICCYCERRISQQDSHIEHFKPKDDSQFPQLQLDYTNLHACCVRVPTRSTPNICGNKKDNFYSSDLISPLEEDCSTHFKYASDGHISPSDANDLRATTTIRILGLDEPILVEKRKAIISTFETLDIEDLKAAVQLYLRQDVPQFGEFYTTIEFFYGSII